MVGYYIIHAIYLTVVALNKLHNGESICWILTPHNCIIYERYHLFEFNVIQIRYQLFKLTTLRY